jgi:glutamate-5-semialdehyde dehydrogenase
LYKFALSKGKGTKGIGLQYKRSKSMKSAIKELEEKGKAAKAASRKLAFLSTEVKNKALVNIAEALIDRKDKILAANKIDYDEAKASGMNEAMLDRLMLSPSRLEGIAQDTKTVAALPDPVGEVFEMRTLPNGLKISKKRVPLGVIGAIYESRPNVTIDISSLCLKSGNAVILRGGKEAINSNRALARVAQEACDQAGVPQGAIQLIESTERTLVNHMLKMKGIIDLIIPRGGAGLIKLVSENAAMAVVTGGIGVCHAYVDKSADLNKAVAIAYNAKVQRPTVCNALDCILVHNQIAQAYLPAIAKEWAKAGVEMHCDERARTILEYNLNVAIAKCSQRHENQCYVYWWDITPIELSSVEVHKYKYIILVKSYLTTRCTVPAQIEGYSGEYCKVPVKDLLPLLTPDRQQVTRESRPWGIKVFPDFPNRITVEGTELAPPAVLDVVWLPSTLKLVPATDEDWGKEYLSLKAAIKVVNSLDEALEHIEKYGSGHSEAIVTEDHSAATRFLNEVDAACVYANASTRFTDGGQFGLGAEIGISTQKFHARGPMALKELTSYKWIILGSGQVRP